MLTNILSPDLIGWEAWNEKFLTGNILLLHLLLLKFVRVVAPFVALSCRCFGLEFVATVSADCAVVLEVGSFTFVAWSWFPHDFDLSYT